MRSFLFLLLLVPFGAAADIPVPTPRPNPEEAAPRPAEQGAPVTSKAVRVTAKSLRVRTAEGIHVCSIRRGTQVTAIGRDPNQDRLKVRINARGCPSEAYVSSAYVMPDGEGWNDIVTKVEAPQLALRGRPSPSGAFRCGLPRDTEVVIINEEPERAASGSWVEVALTNPVSGCPDRGFVNSSYLQPSDVFKQLPFVNEVGSGLNADHGTEAGTPCADGSCERGSPGAQNIQDLVDASQVGPKNPFLEELRKMIRNPGTKPQGFNSHRGLIQMPLLGNRGNIGPCGSFHYNPDQPVGVDAYANPVTACAFTAFLQDWKKNECPDREGGCRIAWGNISHRTQIGYKRGVWPHRTHTDGHCIDVRPARSGAFADSPMTWRQRGYDRETMKKMIAKMKDYGADTMYFNDRACGTAYASGHDNHLHVCFKPGPKTRAACDNLVIDPQTCPELM